MFEALGGGRPEWPGAVSGKFTDKIHGNPHFKRHVAPPQDVAAVGLTLQGFEGYFTDTAGLQPGQGKRAVPHTEFGEVATWRSSIRCLSEPGALQSERPEGRRPVDLPLQKIKTLAQRRHLRANDSKEEYGDRPNGLHTVYRENGLRAADQPAREVDISHEMARKARADDLYAKRNGIACCRHGDKPYRHPEYERNFHKAGGLVVGSGFLRGNFKKTEPRNSTTVPFSLDATKKQLKSYEEKYWEQQRSEAQAEVQALTRSWESAILRDCEEAKFDHVDSDDEEASAVAA
mmetsp:Transcript_93492/g.204710  ORF Transcript_93492/g.204710 Transcript_93492/m.204710 type:complete len:290 (-) Transcript_93492:158-1027(-)|eukprot:CAMPEP_0206495572 /NCGR_PEP_ID=MMETSP0324_2-20121206/48680_1 /ASSEMBLY_ACC=CAM_ASM_000836 /TAXON_ID=2866 /ORGANISM="Crypthecodinium cohnii, Strain Seligo" /LENGTH=289 /DNA_ID=CAMNT_0053979997 /DNA_START=57 /DNA_END=926 /DNA_ORIENTATION=-